MASGKASSPQTWNRYTYVGNNPLVFTDPTGLTWFSQLSEDGKTTTYRWFTGDPGEGWQRVTDFNYDSGGKNGWVALDPLSGNWTDGHKSRDDAAGMFSLSQAIWNAHNSWAGAGDSISSAGAFGRSFANRFFGIDANVAPGSTPHRAGWWIGLGSQIVLSIAAGGAGGATTGAEAGLASLGDDVANTGSQVFQRVASTAELEATQATGLLRGGRPGPNFFTNAASLDAKRAQIRLGLDGPLRDYRITFQITDGTRVAGPQVAKAGQSGTTGGGLEFFTSRSTQIQVLSVKPLKK